MNTFSLGVSLPFSSQKQQVNRGVCHYNEAETICLVQSRVVQVLQQMFYSSDRLQKQCLQFIIREEAVC